ncbi:MAG: DUF1460 domain-containing protein [Thermodesulfovibrionales bacterium]|nr:DUF1460 domain-containing protein [Thermodesulfovibrionales bacterium]
MIKISKTIGNIGKKIDFISSQFLNIPYKKNTLIGNFNSQEILTINFDYVDCFTFLDYVEALRQSNSFVDFIENLKKVRYKDATVDYKKRNHFFTDWIDNNSKSIENITHVLGKESSITIKKILNLKQGNIYHLPGIEPKPRNITYLPKLTDHVISLLQTGDYIGIYSHDEWLDVSHVGIIIKKDTLYLRHASAQKKVNRVIDEELLDYLHNKPGIIILRPK